MVGFFVVWEYDGVFLDFEEMVVVNLVSVFLCFFEMGVYELCEGMRLEKKNDWLC